MNAPIPEPMIGPPMMQRGERPATLNVLLMIEIWFCIAAEFIPQPPESWIESFVYYGISIGWAGLFCCLWMGKNWARIRKKRKFMVAVLKVA